MSVLPINRNCRTERDIGRPQILAYDACFGVLSQNS